MKVSKNKNVRTIALSWAERVIKKGLIIPEFTFLDRRPEKKNCLLANYIGKLVTKPSIKIVFPKVSLYDA